MENNFVWTDELVQKFAEEYRFSSSRTSIEQFKEYEKEKNKEPLFTTEDGKEIYEGDKYWHVSITYDIAPCKAGKDVKYNLFESRTFSTQKAAEEYIIINKPCLSITDVGSVLSGNLSLRVAAELKELVKSKL